MKNTNLYKDTEIGRIPVDWEVKKLGEVCIDNGIIRGPFGGALKKEFFVDDGYKVYEQRNAIYQDANIGDYYINKNKFNELKRFEVNYKDFIISCSGTIGRIYQIPKNYIKGVINQALLLIKLNNELIDDKFFYQYFIWEEFQKKILDNTQGGAMKNIVGMQILKQLSILIPPIQEQQGIAEVLSDMDDLKNLIDKLIEKKKKIKEGTMELLLTGKKRLEGFSEEWEVKKLGEVTEVQTGSTPSTRDSSNYGNEYLFVSPVDLGKRKYITNTEKKLSSKGFDISRKFIKDSILFTCIGSTIGKLGIAEFDLTSNQQINAIMPNSSYDSQYLYYILSYLSKAIKASASEQAVPIINKSDFERVEIPLPPLPEQQAIAQILSDMDAEIEALEAKLNKYKQIKEGAMEKLLSGEVRLI